jgi:predicted transcriptional regulator
MGTIAVRLPDDTHKRIKELAAPRKTSTNKLYKEFAAMTRKGIKNKELEL